MSPVKKNERNDEKNKKPFSIASGVELENEKKRPLVSFFSRLYLPCCPSFSHYAITDESTYGDGQTDRNSLLHLRAFFTIFFPLLTRLDELSTLIINFSFKV